MGYKHENVCWSASHGEMSVTCRYSLSTHKREKNGYLRFIETYSLSETETKGNISHSVPCRNGGRWTETCCWEVWSIKGHQFQFGASVWCSGVYTARNIWLLTPRWALHTSIIYILCITSLVLIFTNAN